MAPQAAGAFGANAPRHHVLDLGGARQVVERAPERPGRDVLRQPELAPYFRERFLEDRRGAEASIAGGEEKIRRLLFWRAELRVDVPLEDEHRLLRQVDRVAMPLLGRPHLRWDRRRCPAAPS
jgi:hypothetical protein